MNNQHRKPVLAFIVLAVVAAAVIGNQVRASAERVSVLVAGPVVAHGVRAQGVIPAGDPAAVVDRDRGRDSSEVPGVRLSAMPVPAVLHAAAHVFAPSLTFRVGSGPATSDTAPRTVPAARGAHLRPDPHSSDRGRDGRGRDRRGRDGRAAGRAAGPGAVKAYEHGTTPRREARPRHAAPRFPGLRQRGPRHP